MKKVLLILCLLAIVYVATMPLSSPSTRTLAASKQNTPTITKVTQAFNVLGSPTITATHIEQILDAARSPARGTGQALYDLGVQSGIDPVFALAFFQHESAFGRAGIAATNFGLGNIRCTTGYHCLYGFRAYRSWQAGYADWYQLIRYYCDTWSKCTVEQIVPTYAPASENDVSGYITNVEEAVKTWRRQ